MLSWRGDYRQLSETEWMPNISRLIIVGQYLRYRFRDLKGILIGWGDLFEDQPSHFRLYISLIRVRSSAAHPTASRREIRDRRASLIAPFPSQASPPLSSLTSPSLPRANFRDCRRLSLITAAVASAASSTAMHFRIYARTRLIADYRVYESACFAKLRCYRQDFARTSNYVCMDLQFFTFYPRNVFLLRKYWCTVIVSFFISCDKQLTFF